MDRNSLIEAVSIAFVSANEKGAVPGSDIAVLECVDGALSISCSDGQTQSIARVFGQDLGTFSARVEARVLNDAVRGMPQTDVQISVSGKALTVSCGRASVRMSSAHGLGIERFQLPAGSATQAVKFDDLSRVIKTAIIHTEGNRGCNPNFDAICIKGGIARSTNGRTACTAKLLEMTGDFDLTIDAARKILKLPLGEQRVDMITSGNRCALRWNKGEFNFAPFHLRMPDFSGVFPAEHSDSQWVRVECQELVKLAKFGEKFANNLEITIEAKPDCLSLSSNAGGIGSTFAVDCIQHGAVGFRGIVNPNYLSMVLESIIRNDGIAIMSMPNDNFLYLTDDLQNTKSLVMLIQR